MSQRIAINLLQFSPKSATGSFVYIKNLLDSIFLLDKNNFYYLLLTSASCPYFKKRYGHYFNVKYRIVDVRRDILFHPARALFKFLAKAKKNRRAQEIIIEKEIQRFIDKNKINMIFFPSGTIYPAGLKNIKIITTILDLQHEYFPDNFSPEYLKRRKTDCIYAAKNSDRLIAISDFTKQSLVEKYRINPDKIAVIYLAPQNLISCQRQIDLPKSFIFYPAAFWPHKNHKILIEALNLLQYKFPNLHLIFTGIIKNKKIKEELEALAGSYKLNKRVHFLGFVADEDMPLIYKNAKILVYPSSFEGFGIPLVEAFNYGVPVIAAENSSITEVVGNAGVLVPTGNAKMLADAVVKVLTDDVLRQELIRKGYERVGSYSWEKTARETLDIFNNL